MRISSSFLLIGLGLYGIPSVGAEIDFQNQIAPILSEHCVRCHSANNPKGDISLENVQDLHAHGYLESGTPGESYLIELVEGVDGEPPQMPKDGPPLSMEQVSLLRQWVAEGGRWPQDVVVRERAKADSSWWSLQPVAPQQTHASIDDFVNGKLQEQGLEMNAPADRRTLIRRATYDLLGLPPTPDEIDAFVADDDPMAYEKLIDRLLESPHYGERWGRHWLDVVRFGESNGYERNVIIHNAWPFRDYVIRSINGDKPFDQFIREHLAGDVFGADDPNVAVGSVFLVAGPYDDVGNQDAIQAAQIRANTLDEIIRATSDAFLGMTIGCARCHDHKFDPILQSDYYALYATFAGVRHGSVPLATPQEKAERAARLEPLAAKRATLEKAITDLKQNVLERGKAKLSTYRERWTRGAIDRAGTEEQFDPIVAKYVRLTCEARDSDLESKQGFGIDEFEVWSVADGIPSENVALAANGGKATGASRHIEDFPEAYSPRLAIDGQTGARFIAASDTLTIELARPTRINRIVFSSARNAANPRQGKFSFVAEYRIHVSVDGQRWDEVANSYDRAPTDYDQNPTHEEYRLLKLEISDEETKTQSELQEQLDRVAAKISSVPNVPSVWIGTRNQEDAKGPFHVFLGGNPQKLGDEIVASSLSAIDDPSRYRLQANTPEAERRRALAEWITNERNPLTPRVLANRIWHYHFGTGIVDTPSDFGYMGGRPTHPELLDFLAAKLLESHWRLKPLHRLIMSSQVYRQSSAYRSEAAGMDGDARLLWRFPPRRLSAEEIRDTALMVAGKIRKQPNDGGRVPDGGPGFRLYHFMQDNVCTYVPLDEHGPSTYRRAVYHQNARASVVDLMTDFDQPDCAFSTPRRSETTTPLQALTMLNHKFTLDMAEAMAARLQREVGSDPLKQVVLAYQLCFGREPTDDESSNCRELMHAHGARALCRVLLNTSELIYVR